MLVPIGYTYIELSGYIYFLQENPLLAFVSCRVGGKHIVLEKFTASTYLLLVTSGEDFLSPKKSPDPLPAASLCSVDLARLDFSKMLGQ